MISMRTRLPALTVVILSLAGCSTEREKPVQSLTDVLTSLAPKASAFEMDPDAKTMLLKGEKGTVVYISRDAFQFADGTVPTGTINIELKECYSLTDMIGQNMSTTSGDRILETGGMVYFQATSDGKQLSLKDKKAIVVAFPKGSQTKEMDLFYSVTLNDTLATWVPDYSMSQVEAQKAAQADSTLTEGDSGVYEGVAAQYPIEMTDDLFDYRFRLHGMTSSFYDLKFAGQNRSMLDYIEDPTTIADSTARTFVKNDWWVPYEFNIDGRGKIVNLRALDEKYGTPVKYNAYAFQVVKTYLENAPAFDLSTIPKGVEPDFYYYLGIQGTKRLNLDRYKKRFREQYASYNTQAVQKMDKNALDYYMFAVTEMGWINCDRFWDTDDPKIDFIVKTKAPGDAKVQLVFQDINSIMTGKYKNGHIVFNNVPVGRKVKVIGINYANGKPAMATAETTVNKAGFELSTFREFTLDELERELNAPKK
jgi:hypothetical protein